MSAAERIAALEVELKHASAIAACSIGQSDRAANVAYREEIRAKLQTSRAAAGEPHRRLIGEPKNNSANEREA